MGWKEKIKMRERERAKKKQDTLPKIEGKTKQVWNEYQVGCWSSPGFCGSPLTQISEYFIDAQLLLNLKPLELLKQCKSHSPPEGRTAFTAFSADAKQMLMSR